ncbi:MAG: DUF1295 domain-containing protein [Acidimicrobiales bacterium]
MKQSTALFGIAASVVVGFLVALAGSDGSVDVGSLPLFGLCGLLAFGINWIVFVPSYLKQTERFYDLTGSLTYLTLTGVALAFSDLDARAALVAALVVIWAVRLGSFLFKRISSEGGDSRFTKLKTRPAHFLMMWSIQGLWVLFTLACALAAITGEDRSDLGIYAFVGTAIWVGGFVIEVVADRQKSAFRADPKNKGRYITTGLWAWSRHPNYFGEIVLWAGIAVIALPILAGWAWVTLISPLFVYFLLTQISGLPIQERQAKHRWGDDEGFQTYVQNTPALVLRPPRNDR